MMLRKIRRMIGTVEHVAAIADEKIYMETKNSYAGGSLTGSEVLVVSNGQEGSETIRLLNLLLNVERCNEIRNCYISNHNKDFMEIVGNDVERKFSHIINWIEISLDESKITTNCDMEMLYHILQKECNYFATNDICGTVCTVIINNGQDDISSEAEIGGMKSLISGLGYIMPKQKVIVNGVVAFKDVPVDEIVHSAIYLSSKYGQILTGEVFIMKNKQ